MAVIPEPEDEDDDDDNAKLFTGTSTCDDHDEDHQVNPSRRVRFGKTPSFGKGTTMKMPKINAGKVAKKMKSFVPKVPRLPRRAPGGGAKMGLLGDSDDHGW